jgi:hypothetical protein
MNIVLNEIYPTGSYVLVISPYPNCYHYSDIKLYPDNPGHFEVLMNGNQVETTYYPGYVLLPRVERVFDLQIRIDDLDLLSEKFLFGFVIHVIYVEYSLIAVPGVAKAERVVRERAVPGHARDERKVLVVTQYCYA